MIGFAPMQIEKQTLMACSFSLLTGCRHRTSTPTPDYRSRAVRALRSVGVSWEVSPASLISALSVPDVLRDILSRPVACSISSWRLHVEMFRRSLSIWGQKQDSCVYLFKLLLDIGEVIMAWHFGSLVLNLHDERPSFPKHSHIHIFPACISSIFVMKQPKGYFWYLQTSCRINCWYLKGSLHAKEEDERSNAVIQITFVIQLKYLTSCYEFASVTTKARKKNIFNFLLHRSSAFLLPINCPRWLTNIPALSRCCEEGGFIQTGKIWT